MTPLHTQKMLLFIMQKGTIYVNIGIFTASLEGFATVKLKVFLKTKCNVGLT